MDSPSSKNVRSLRSFDRHVVAVRCVLVDIRSLLFLVGVRSLLFLDVVDNVNKLVLCSLLFLFDNIFDNIVVNNICSLDQERVEVRDSLGGVDVKIKEFVSIDVIVINIVVVDNGVLREFVVEIVLVVFDGVIGPPFDDEATVLDQGMVLIFGNGFNARWRCQ
jgi:hypothetical protein